MKTLIIIIVLCMACLLAGCKNPANSDDTSEPAEGPGIVTEDIFEQEEELPIDTSAAITADPVTDESEELEESEEPEEPAPQPGDFKVHELKNIYAYPVLSHDRLIFFRNDYKIPPSLVITDLDCNELEVFSFDEDDYVMDIRAGEGDVLCTFTWFIYTPEESEYKSMTIYTDMTMSESKEEDLYITVGDHSITGAHRIKSSWINIVDAETGEILVEGAEGENKYGIDRLFQEYGMSIDENRFLYITRGYESIPGFGIYDFTTGKATHVPDSKDRVPLGIYDGYIYSENTTWDGIGTEIFRTNIETLETEFAFSASGLLENGGYIWYQMFPDSEHLLIVNDYYITGEDGSFREGIVKLYKVAVTDGSVAWQYTLPLDASLQSRGAFLDEDTYLLTVHCRGETGSYSEDMLLEITLG